MSKTTKNVKVKTPKLKPFEKVLNVLISGQVTTKEELDALLGEEIMMYRISTYMWHIKTIANGIIRVTKDGRKVAGYQLINVNEAKKYLEDNGILLSKVEKLSDISEPVEQSESIKTDAETV
jgi:hypothetical protein